MQLKADAAVDYRFMMCLHVSITANS